MQQCRNSSIPQLIFLGTNHEDIKFMVLLVLTCINIVKVVVLSWLHFLTLYTVCTKRYTGVWRTDIYLFKFLNIVNFDKLFQNYKELLLRYFCCL